MNKILKIIIKSDPIFKYIVEDYPFYEGIFFHSKDFHKIKILNSHYLLKQRLKINKGSAGFFYVPKYLMHFNKINLRSITTINGQMITKITFLYRNVTTQKGRFFMPIFTFIFKYLHI